MDNSSMPPVMIYENKTPPAENLRFMACFYSPARGDAIAYNFTGETREIAEASIKSWWDRNNVPKPVGKSEIVKKVVDENRHSPLVTGDPGNTMGFTTVKRGRGRPPKAR
jgi:hypothetical protein